MQLIKGLIVIVVLCSKCLESESCTLTDEGDSICIAQIDCHHEINDIVNLIYNWQCYADYGNTRYVDIIIENIDINDNMDLLVGLPEQYRTKIRILKIYQSNIVSVPFQVYSLSHLHDLVSVESNIESIDLDAIALMHTLNSVNVSHNIIRQIEIGHQVRENSSMLKMIDLSHNLIESIQDYSFSQFTHLQYLDMSHNRITNIDILTFEGIFRLETLYLSNNSIKELGQNFVRFVNLNKLSLDNNNLTKITEMNFKTLTSLVNLNLSSNKIKEIEDRSFYKMQNLEQLDLSYNKISTISNKLFTKNTRIINLNLSYNNLQQIEENSFQDAHITEFVINNNSLSGSIEENIFLGIFVTELNLSDGKITRLGNKAFSALGPTLETLNLSKNLIANISTSSFHLLYLLKKLDLSNNKLIEMSFDKSDLRNITEFRLSCNNIKSILNSFKGMFSLLKLDLSNNKIDHIDLESFVDLINLEELVLSNNFLVNIFANGTFNRLPKLQHLYLVNTTTTLYQNDTLSGMRSLKEMNSSYGGLMKIDYNTFKDTGALQIVDISHNMLEVFNVNSSHLKNVQELYLNNNLLRQFAAETFFELHRLNKLNLASNNIEVIDPKSLQPLVELKFLNLSSNYFINIDSRMFDNLDHLSEIYLNDIKTPLSFNKSVNVSIAILHLSLSNIIDIGSMELYHIKDILKLVLSSNKMNYLDKHSFQSMPTLDWLDLSMNMISHIQPGTFQFTPNINVLNLARNCLFSLEFGVLDGLNNLHILNLSSNAIHAFSANLLHSTPFLTYLSLDNNHIINIDFREFADKSLQKLSIGGNSITCDSFIALNSLHFGDMVVTAEQLLYNEENVHGITCKTLRKSNETIYQGTDVNITSYLSMLIKIQQRLYDVVEKSINESTLLKKEDLQHVYSNFANQLKEITGKKQIDNNEQLNYYLSNISNIWVSVFENVTTLANKILITYNNITDSMQNSQNKEYHVIREMLQEIKNGNVEQINALQKTKSESQVHGSKQDLYYLSDIRVLLYVIEVCLASAFVMQLLLIAYRQKCFMCKRKTQVISNELVNSMEM